MDRQDRPPDRAHLAQAAVAAPVVRLPADADQGRQAATARCSTPSDSSRRDIARDFGVDPARMQTILLGVDDVFAPPTAPRVPGPDPRDGQRRRPDEGHRDAARGLRQAERRARRLARAGHPPRAGRAHRAADRPARHRRQGHLRQRRQRRRARRGDGLRRGGVRAVALRGLLAADRRADGLRDPARRVARRRDPGGRRSRRRVRRPGHPRRRGRAGAGDRRAARRPGAAYGDGRGRPRPRRGAVQLARRGRGHRRRLRGDHRRLRREQGRREQEESRRADR